MEKEYIDIEKNTVSKVSKTITDKFKMDCKTDIEKVIAELNKLFQGKEFSNVGDFWKENYQNDRGSWSFIKRELENYGYRFNSNEKEFQIDKNIISNNQNETKGSDIINTIIATKKKEKDYNNYKATTVKVDETVWNNFKDFCKGFEMSQEKILTLALVELMEKVNQTENK